MLFDQNTQHVFQVFDDKSQNRSLAKTFTGTLQNNLANLSGANSVGAGVFFTVNAMRGGRRSNKNTSKIRALFCDLDTQDFDRKFDYRLRPSAVVESSPGKHHCYWFVSDFEIDEFSAYQKKLAAITGGDPVVCDLARVMRYPGFHHCKTDTRFESQILEHTGEIYPAIVLKSWIDCEYTPTPEPQGDYLTSMRSAKPGTRNDTLNKIAFEVSGLVKSGQMPNDSLNRLARAALQAGLEPAEIKATIQSAWGTAKPAEPFDAPFQNLESGGDKDRLKLIKASSLKPESINWLWPDWLAAGKMHILAGQAGTGKTTAALSFAAIVSSGGRWPDGSSCDQGDVIIWSGEDGIQDTLIPRLLRAGANLERVHFVHTVFKNGKECYFNPATDVALLNQAVTQLHNVKLIIIDPIISAVSGDSNKANDVRNNLAPLYRLADKHNIALLGITHFNKSSNSTNVLDRVTGSQAFGALARVVFACVHNKDGSGQRSFVKVKANICSDQGGFAYSIDHSNAASCVEWGDYLTGDAADIVSAAEATAEESYESNQAVKLMREILSEDAHSWAYIIKTFAKNGLSAQSAKKARSTLALVDRGGAWGLPP